MSPPPTFRCSTRLHNAVDVAVQLIGIHPPPRDDVPFLVRVPRAMLIASRDSEPPRLSATVLLRLVFQQLVPGATVSVTSRDQSLLCLAH
jgi:hypothetical protein